MHTPHTIAAVSAAALELSYGTAKILRGIDLTLKRGRTLALLGPSGCGKTTLLRLIAGLLAPTAGTIAIAGEVVADAASGRLAPPERRDLGMVFQDYALWPHLTVGGNVSFPLEMRGMTKADRNRRTLHALERVGLAAYADRRPSDLSGGQQQRVAIARAIVAEPRLILFDEPLSNLDRELRENMVGELAELIATLGLTAIYVTHDHAEALTLADEVAVMRGGMIEQLARPDDLVAKPRTPEVAEFLRLGGLAEIDRRGNFYVFKGTDTKLGPAGPGGPAGGRVLIPTGAVTAGETGSGILRAKVLRSQFRGDGHIATASPQDLPHIELQLLSRVKLRPSEIIGLSIETSQLHWFETSGSSFKQESLQHA